MRLIDADALIDFIDCGHLRNPLESCFSERDVVDMLESRPTISAVPVVRGEWICNPDNRKFSLVCSVCGQVMPFIPEHLPDNPPFCNCGADMRRESEVKE